MGVPRCLAVRGQAEAGEEQHKVHSAGTCRGSQQGCSLLQRGAAAPAPPAPAVRSTQTLQRQLLCVQQCPPCPGSPRQAVLHGLGASVGSSRSSGGNAGAPRTGMGTPAMQGGPWPASPAAEWVPRQAPPFLLGSFCTDPDPLSFAWDQGAGRAPGVRLRRSGLPLPRELSLSTSESCSLSISSGFFFSLFLTAASNAFCLR